MGLLFLGDSITAGWGGRGKKVWDENYAKYEPANFGIGGDRTQHVLWRIENGELDGIKPKVLVLMIGTNNIGSTPDQIATGTTAVVKAVRTKLPEARILLLSIFPRSELADHPNRGKLQAVNDQLAKLDDGPGGKVKFFKLWDQFLDPAGTLSKEIMPDGLHPTAQGVAVIVRKILPTVQAFLAGVKPTG